MARRPIPMSTLTSALLLACVAAAAASIDYSTSPPGGLSPDQVPQFILFTHDDAINSESMGAVRGVADGRVVNGCPLTATLFTKVEGTDCDDLLDMYHSGYEVADHSITHSDFLTMGSGDVEYELVGARQQLAQCGIPENAIVGVRTPYLRTDASVRQLIQDNGFLYDSTQRMYGEPSERVWPWDMADGIPDCDSDGVQTCDSGESHPGLYEVPVWFLEYNGHEYHMNYADDGAVDVYEFLKSTFDRSYDGNRAPFPIFVHTPWIESFDAGLRKFVDYVSAKPDTYFVTMRQLLAWMANPIPKDQVTPRLLGCGNEGGAGPIVPVETFKRDPEEPSASSGSAAPAPAPSQLGAPTPAPAPAPAEGGAAVKLAEGALESGELAAP